YTRTGSQKIAPTYSNAVQAVYLLDLRSIVPDSVVLCNNNITPHLKGMIPPGRDYNFYSDLMDIEFPANSVYDTVYLSTRHTIGSDSLEVFTVGSRIYPLNKAINVTVRPLKKYAWDKSYSVYRIAGKGYTYLGGGLLNGSIHFSTREFGDFVILRDTVPPTIKPIAVNGTVARFKIKDNLSGIHKFEANING